MTRSRAFGHFTAAVLAIGAGVIVAAARYPGGFDWSYTVISKLASLKHNPAGGAWLSGGLLAGMIMAWPLTGYLLQGPDAGSAGRRAAVGVLRVGMAGGVLLGLEGLFSLDLSRLGRKGHEVLALATFLGLYGGVLGLQWQRMRRDAAAPWATLLVVLPIVAVGASQLALYLGQRELGWVNTGWRDLGVPLWLSFAFWQWLAVALLWVGLGHLVATRDDRQAAAQMAPRATRNSARGPRPEPGTRARR